MNRKWMVRYSCSVLKSLLCCCSATGKNLISFGKYRKYERNHNQISARSYTSDWSVVKRKKNDYDLNTNEMAVSTVF